MIERKSIINCEANVIAKMDFSKSQLIKKLASNLVSLHCPKLDKTVGIEGTDTLFGVPMNIKCQNKECPFNKDRAPDLSDRPTMYPV